ncbi:MAG: four helix bundle protein [Alphaproteobacteria bacterium]|nr:four helix bundle protein [Alphaproteobacteria bacterium]MCL2757932.1 four helix bundle protein [Alphaproteobacteria bacterium]
MKDKPILQKSALFAARIVKMCKYLGEIKKEFVISKQVIRSGTSIGANLSEAYCASSRKDFIAKFHIAFKECEETLYWLNLEFISEKQFESIYSDCKELVKLISSTIRTSKNNPPVPGC